MELWKLVVTDNKGEKVNQKDDDISPNLLDTFIQDVTNNKKTLDSTMETVMHLMREVECEERAAEQAKEEAETAWSCSDMIAKLNQLQQAQQCLEKTNEFLASEVNVGKELLATKIKTLQLRVASLLDDGNTSLEILDEMHRALEIRLTSALTEKELANKKKQETEAFSRAAIAYEEIQMEKVKEESKRLKREAVEVSKLQEFLIDRGHVVDALHGEISDKCKDAKRLKAELDQAILLSGLISSSQTFSILPYQSQPEQADSDVLFKKSSDYVLCDSTHGNVQSVNTKRIKCGESRPFGKMSAKSVKKVKINNKLRGNQRYAKSIKKVKIKGKLHGHQMSAKGVKILKLQYKLHGDRRFTKRNKLKIIRKLRGSRMFAKSIKIMKIKGKLHGTRRYVKADKKVKIKIKLHGNQLFAQRINNMKTKGLRVVSKRSTAGLLNFTKDSYDL